MDPLIVALAIGIVSYIGFVLMFPKAVPDDGADHTRQALDRIYEENRAADSEQGNIMRDALRDESQLVRSLFGLSFLNPLYEVALQAGYGTNLITIVWMMAGSFLVTLGALVFMDVGILSLLLAVLLAYYIPYRHCRKRIRARDRKFIDQFPDALDMIVRSVRSGFPLSVALQMLAENAESPVKDEFRQVADEVALGRTLPQALARMATRINQPDIRFFVVVLSVQQETGGNLAEIIGNLSNIIRKRKQLRHKIRAMTSEGRATAWILGLLPVLVFCALFFLQREYVSTFWTDPMGMLLFGIAATLIATCVVVINKMVDIDI